MFFVCLLTSWNTLSAMSGLSRGFAHVNLHAQEYVKSMQARRDV